MLQYEIKHENVWWPQPATLDQSIIAPVTKIQKRIQNFEREFKTLNILMMISMAGALMVWALTVTASSSSLVGQMGALNMS